MNKELDQKSFISGMAVGGLLIWFVIMFLTACAPQEPLPTFVPLPTHTDAPPLPTLEPLPTSTSRPTYTPFSTDVPPTLTPPPTETYLPPTAVPPLTVKVMGTVSKVLVREVCFNLHGFIYNNAGFPVLSDCIYPLKGETSDRIKYFPGNKVEVEPFGDNVFYSVHGFYTRYAGSGLPTIKADGGEQYYVLTERGENGKLLFLAAWLVRVVE